MIVDRDQPCPRCTSTHKVEVPIHDGESMRVDCRDCEDTCFGHFETRKPRWEGDKPYKVFRLAKCPVCRYTFGFSRWNGKEI